MSSGGILGMFARSPIRPLQQHMTKAHGCASLLIPFFTAINNEDWNQANSLREEIMQLEHEADDLKMDFRLHLPKSLLLPVPRHDLLALLSQQELIANTAKDISGIVIGRKMTIPEALQELFMQYAERCVDTCTQALRAIEELDELLEAGFRGKMVEVVTRMIQELNKIEHDTDILQIRLRDALFKIEDHLKAVDVMFLYKIFDWLGQLANAAENVGGRLRMLTAH